MNNEMIFNDASLLTYLSAQYSGVFDESQLQSHIRNYVGFATATQLVEIISQQHGAGIKILDVGSGFGSFVLEARRQGYNAVGIEMALFEVEYARKRLHDEIPELVAEDVYKIGDANKLLCKSECFDVVTLWNVLEHVPECERIISECYRVLRPGGFLYLVCPNYLSFRDEAHYHVFWPSLLPRQIAKYYLKLRGKNPGFFETSIFYRTNWEVISILKKLGFEVSDIRMSKLSNLDAITKPTVKHFLMWVKRLHLLGVVKLVFKLISFNPFKQTISLICRK